MEGDRAQYAGYTFQAVELARKETLQLKQAWQTQETE
jgi:hypothetical protein